MKKIIYTFIFSIIFIISLLVFVLSTSGYETSKFNNFISEKIAESNQEVYLKLETIKFKLDIKKINLFLETKNPIVKYKNLNIPVENIKIYLDLVSLIKSNTKIDNVNILFKEIDIEELKKIIIKTKPSTLNSIINNQVVKGKLKTSIELYFDNDFRLDNFIARGKVRNAEAIINKNLTIKDINFNFFADNSDALFQNINGETKGILIKNGDLKIEKNDNLIVSSNFFTDFKFNNEIFKDYLNYTKNSNDFYQVTNVDGAINNNLNIIFDKTYKIKNFEIKSRGKINDLRLILKEPFESRILTENLNSFSVKESNFNFRYSSDKKNFININGLYRFNENKFEKISFKNNFKDKVSNITLDFDTSRPLKVDLINYNKDKNIKSNILSQFKLDTELIEIKELKYSENKNNIIIKKLKIKKNKFLNLGEVKIKTFKDGNLNNDFKLNIKNIIRVKGKKYDATQINKILNEKKKNNYLSNLDKKVEIDLQNIDTPLSKKISNFKLIGSIKKGNFAKISSKGDFGNNKYLDISLKSDEKNQKKYLEIYSDLPQPLLSEYKFFKGLSGGVMVFSSIIEGDSSVSKLNIENFKIINAPGVVKLLSIADFGGLADLAEGEGLSFDKLEINMSNKNNFLKLEEFYAVGPSISVLMEGYKDANGLTSLKGTLVPAKNLNKLLSKIPLIGKIIIPKDVGEGLFGVSFKMKGLPGEIKTTVNPIKTLTPRFITKALEKTKKTK